MIPTIGSECDFYSNHPELAMWSGPLTIVHISKSGVIVAESVNGDIQISKNPNLFRPHRGG